MKSGDAGLTSRMYRVLTQALLVLALVVIVPSATRAFELDVVVPGGDADLTKSIRNVTLLGALAEDGATDGRDIVAAAKADYARIVGYLYNDAYFSSVVSIALDGQEASGVSVFASNRNVTRVRIRVEPGPKFQFGRAEIGPYPAQTVRPEAFRTGEIASLEVMQDAVSTGVTGWREEGHAKADVASQSITAQHPARRLDVDIRLNPGPKLVFGRLRTSGQTSLSDARLRQIAGLPTGEVFDPRDVDRVTTRLRRTGVFDTVAVKEAETIGPNNTLDVEVQVADALPRRFGFGAEVSSEEGIEISGYWLHRNFLGGGERLRIRAEVGGLAGDSGGEDFQLDISFLRPATPTYKTDLFIDAEAAILDEPNFKSERIRLEAGLRHYSSDNREYTYALGYEAAETEDAFGQRDYRIFTFPVTHTRDYRDNELNATSGYYAKFALTPFAAVSGTKSGARFYADGRIYRSFGSDARFTFALRGQLGSVVGPKLSRTPADYLFFSGGSGTVRGQSYQSLGVTQASGRTSGGRSFLGLSGEIRAKTGERLSIVGFWDAGYVGEEVFPDGESGDWHTGAGIGGRYDTGFGPVRVDLGIPITGPGSNSGFELYIGIGQAF